jgi:predicted transcriptional regulator YdeE
VHGKWELERGYKMTEISQVHMEDLWSVRRERLGNRWLIGVQNQIPQSYEDEQRLFATLKARRDEIQHQTADPNTYMVIHDDGSKMTVALMVSRIGDIPEGMVSLNLPEEEYEVFRFEEKHICSFWQYFCETDHRNKYGVNAAKARFETFNDTLQPNGVTEIYYPKE